MTGENEIIIAGTKDDHDGYYEGDAFVFKLSNSGDSIFFKSYSDELTQMSATSISETIDGNFIFTGSIEEDGKSDDCLIAKIDEEGNMLWYHSYNFDNGNIDYGAYIQETEDAGYLIMGGTGSGNIFFMKLDEEGLPIYTVENQATAFQITPNPASNHILVHNIDSKHEYNIEILSENGIIIFSEKNIWDQSKSINIKNFPPGIYFYRIYSSEEKNLSAGKLFIY